MVAKKTAKKVVKKRIVKNPVKKEVDKAVSNDQKAKKSKQSLADNAPMRLKGMLYHRMRSEFAEYDAANSKLKLVSVKLAQLLSEPEHRAVALHMQAEKEAARELQKQRIEFAEVQKDVARKFNIPLAEVGQYSFDSESGILLPPGPLPRRGN